jgi:type IV pilus assembly protein PilA
VISKIKNRMASEQGFTLIELLVVIVILGILVAIAVPSYLSFRGNASQAAAQANVRSAIPAAEGYYQSPTAGNGSYTAMNTAALIAQAPGVAPSIAVKVSTGGQAYCIADTNSGKMAYYVGGTATDFTALNGHVVSVVTTGSDCSSITA